VTAHKNPVQRQLDAAVLAAVMALVNALPERRPLVLGLCGAQGSGKSTLAAAVVDAARARGLAAATLSLDDLYLTRAERAVLAREVHPLLATRGVPGTHDVGLGLDLLARIDAGETVRLPRFDKAADDRAPEAEWTTVPGPLDLLVFEGWCLGAVAEDASALVDPVNALEASEDADARWRRWVNAQLAGAYAGLFARIDAIVLLAAPGFEVVFDWRLEQERSGAGAMDAPQVARFIQHYERLTRHVLAEMPGRADLLIRMDRDRTPIKIVNRSS
jgi:D-glycerate 3-kinase